MKWTYIFQALANGILLSVVHATYLDLVRINRNLKVVSAEIGSYSILKCSNEGGNRSCSPDSAALADYVDVSAWYSFCCLSL